MNIEYTGRSFTINDRTRRFTETKLDKVLKFIEEPVDVHVILDTEKRHQIAELHISHRHGMLQAKDTADEMFEAINGAVETAEKQARRAHKKFFSRRRRTTHRSLESDHPTWPIDVIDANTFGAEAADEQVDASATDDAAVNGYEAPPAAEMEPAVDPDDAAAAVGTRVIKTTHIEIKPMTLDEAAVALEASKNEFFVFLDSTTDRVSVLYRRRDQHYGLIAPEW
ncbi:MAG: ribosome-associated translation inhibitor RaiA [Acidobacteriota bacterium]